jgi:hypothetical protein
MKEKIFEELVLFPVHMGGSDPEAMILLGNRIYKLNESQATAHTYTMAEMIDVIINDILRIELDKNFKTLRKVLLKAFVYCFDKSIENIYNHRARPTVDIYLDVRKLYEGESGGNVPEYIQRKTNLNIGKVALIFNNLMQHIDNNKIEYDKHEITTEELMKCVLFGGMNLGTQFCLRIDLAQPNLY